jgi:hypothetical protein
VTELTRLLRVHEVRARYGLRDRRTARAIMEQAGAFFVAGRLVVPVDRLETWERAQARTATTRPRTTAVPSHATPGSSQPGWYGELARLLSGRRVVDPRG